VGRGKTPSQQGWGKGKKATAIEDCFEEFANPKYNPRRRGQPPPESEGQEKTESQRKNPWKVLKKG